MSSDFLIAGMGINQMQYVALQMMIAKHLGWEVGTFSWHVMNLHIYDRHIDNANVMLDRFNSYDYDRNPGANNVGEGIEFYLECPPKTDFYDIKSSMFKLTGYSSLGKQLQFDMAI